jgi:hypothetical protein
MSADTPQDAPPPADTSDAVVDAAGAPTAGDDQQQQQQNQGPPPPAADDDDDSITERYKVPADLFESLTGIGFSANAVKKSIVAGCIDEKTCMQWLEMHLDHPELNTDLEPHIRVDVSVKRVLTDAERAAKVAELKAKIAQNKRLEKDNLVKKEVEDAKRRMTMGKAMLREKEDRQALQRKLDYEQRIKEKEQDRLTRERLQRELAEDRLVRGGMDREAAAKQVAREFEEKKLQVAEEKKRMQEAARIERENRAREAAEKPTEDAAAPSGGGGGGWDLSRLVGPSESEVAAAAAAAGSQGKASSSNNADGSIVIDFDRDEATVPAPDEAVFQRILARSAERCPATSPESATGRAMLKRVLQAILDTPLERKVRVLKVTSNAFTQKIHPLPLACLYLRQAGFQESASSAALDEAGVHDQLSMAVCMLPRVRTAVAALDAFAASTAAR